MKIDIDHVAKLAKLQLSDGEKIKFTEQLTTILSHFQKLDAINTEGLKPLVHGSEFETILREDTISQNVTPSDLYQNAPSHDDEGFEVDKII